MSTELAIESRPWITGTARWMIRHAGWMAIFSAIFGLFFLAYLPKVSMKPDVDDFVVPKDPDFLFHQEVRKAFPKNNFAILAFKTDDVFTAGNLALLKDLTEAFQNIPGVEDVTSLAKVNDIVGTDDVFSAERLFKTVPTTPQALAALKKRALSHPLYAPHLISRDGTTAAIMIYLDEESGEQRQEALAGVDAVIKAHENRGVKFHLAGWPVTNLELAKYMNYDVQIFMPLTFLAVIATIWFVFRNWILIGLSGLGVGVTVGATVGLASFLGIPLDNASAAVLPIVIALALSDLVHLFSHLDRKVLEKFPNRRDAMEHVLAQILFPCFLTTLNTAIGFAALMWNGVPSIRKFGALAAAGMGFEFIFTFGLILPLLLLFKPEKIYHATEAHNQREIPRLVRGTVTLVHRRPGLVLTLSIFALAWGAWESRKIVVETDLVQYFRASNQHRQDSEFIRDNLAGMNVMDVSFKGARDAFREPAALAYIERIQRRAAQIPGVDATTSITDYFKEMNEAFHADDPAHFRLPERRALVDQYLLLYNARDIEEYVTGGFDWARLRLRLRPNGTREAEVIWKELRQILAEDPPKDFEVRVSGHAVNLVKTARTMVSDQIGNIFSAVGTIWLVMVFVLRSAGMALLFLLPNLFPLVLNFGLMGALGIPIDTGTSLIAASAFGIIVDDTVHFFTRLQEIRRSGFPFGQALDMATVEKGEAALSSAFILSMGFGVLILGHFLPVVYFGILNVFVMVVGMAGDLLFLKSLLILGSRWAAKWRRA